MDVESDVPLVGQERVTRVDAHPHPRLTRDKGSLRVLRRGQRVVCVGEGDEEGVALRTELDPAMPAYSIPYQAVVLGENIDVFAPELLEQPSRAFDVREQERDGSGRELAHG